LFSEEIQNLNLLVLPESTWAFSLFFVTKPSLAMEFKGMLCPQCNNPVTGDRRQTWTALTSCVVLRLSGEASRLQLEAFSDLGKVIQKKSEITF